MATISSLNTRQWAELRRVRPRTKTKHRFVSGVFKSAWDKACCINLLWIALQSLQHRSIWSLKDILEHVARWSFWWAQALLALQLDIDEFLWEFHHTLFSFPDGVKLTSNRSTWEVRKDEKSGAAAKWWQMNSGRKLFGVYKYPQGLQIFFEVFYLAVLRRWSDWKFLGTKYSNDGASLGWCKIDKSVCLGFWNVVTLWILDCFCVVRPRSQQIKHEAVFKFAIEIMWVYEVKSNSLGSGIKQLEHRSGHVGKMALKSHKFVLKCDPRKPKTRSFHQF